MNRKQILIFSINFLSLCGHSFAHTPPTTSEATATDRCQTVLDNHQEDRGFVAGHSMTQILEKLNKVAPTLATVLITGETGTGKEIIAYKIHQRSKRTDKAFVVVNCAALPDNLVESELFGYIKGAFTGASSNKEGLFQAADGGTIFLDEIGELPLASQAKLLRVLEYGMVRPLGTTTEQHINVRIIAATNKNLRNMVRKRKFREDLYYRLNVFLLHLPPLRERPEDIPELVQQFIQEFSQSHLSHVTKISPTALEALKKHHWKGNIRELRSVIERSAISSDHATLELNDIQFDEELGPPPQTDIDSLPTLEDLESYYVVDFQRKLRDQGSKNREYVSNLLRISIRTINTINAKMIAEGKDQIILPKAVQKFYKEATEDSPTVEQLKWRYLKFVLSNITQGNVTAAARIVGISRKHFYNLLNNTKSETPDETQESFTDEDSAIDATPTPQKD